MVDLRVNPVHRRVRDTTGVRGLLLAAALVLHGTACSDAEGPRAVVIGIDGADWKLVESLVAECLSPQLCALRERGSWGPIETLTDMPGTGSDDTDLALWGDCVAGVPADLLAFNDDSPLANDIFMSRIEAFLLPGTYYVEVGGYADVTMPDCFTLEIDCRPSVSIQGATYRISGFSTGHKYSWGIDATGDYDPFSPSVAELEAYNPSAPPPPGVPAGGSAAALAAAFAADISSFSGFVAAFIPPDSFDIAGPTSTMRLFVGLESQLPICEVTSAGCAYNPTIKKG